MNGHYLPVRTSARTRDRVASRRPDTSSRAHLEGKQHGSIPTRRFGAAVLASAACCSLCIGKSCCCTHAQKSDFDNTYNALRAQAGLEPYLRSELGQQVCAACNDHGQRGNAFRECAGRLDRVVVRDDRRHASMGVTWRRAISRMLSSLRRQLRRHAVPIAGWSCGSYLERAHSTCGRRDCRGSPLPTDCRQKRPACVFDQIVSDQIVCSTRRCTWAA